MKLNSTEPSQEQVTNEILESLRNALTDPKRNFRARRGTRMTSAEPRQSHPIHLNPLQQTHPGQNMEKPPLSIPMMAPDLWDSWLYKSQETLNSLLGEEKADSFHLNTLNYPERLLMPLPALNKEYQDPSSGTHAETKLLASKGVNFFVISRSPFHTRQLAKKISLEMNCVLIDSKYDQE